jgi:acyl-CoA thioesterase-1
MPTTLSQIRIVAMGDSLTTGFQSYGFFAVEEGSTPYTDILAEQIRRDFSPSSISVEIINKGIVGELTEQMLARFGSDVIALSPRIVIVLGGSNDLGWGLSPQEIFSNLREMYELSLRSRIAPIACTVPSILGFDAGIPPRMELNRLIQEHCSKAELQCVDLFTATMDPPTRRLNSRYSSDGLHLNADGYGQIGIAIYRDAVAPLLRTLSGQSR